MQERLKEIPKRILGYWHKLTKKQKTGIVSVAAVLTITFIILGMVLSKPQMEVLVTCDSAQQASEVKKLLEDEGIAMKISGTDSTVISVSKKDKANATLLLGANNIPADEYNIETALGGGFSTTESDKEKKYKLYLEEDLAKKLKTMNGVKDATVKLSIPENDGTIISQDADTYASVMLVLNGKLEDGAAETMAKFVSTAVGNSTTESVVIIDSNGNLLFSGEDNSSNSGNASNQLAVKGQAETLVKNQVQSVMLGTNVYDNVEIAPNLVINFDVVNQTTHNYSAPDGREEGMLGHEENYENESSGGGTSGVPGTDSNTTYMINDNGTTKSTTTQNSKDYLPNEQITDTKFAPGTIDYTNSSISIVATQYVIYNKADLKKQGLLKNMTYEQYQQKNDLTVKTTVDKDFYTMVSNATGIPQDKISIVAYQVPFFQADDSSAKSWTDYAVFVLIALILALLGFVVFRSTRPAEVIETEPELSVEALLATTKENQNVEDIDFNDKSETRKMIEKFVDENPGAVAQLLRNWLNDEWE